MVIQTLFEVRAAQNPHYSYPPLMFIHPDQAHVRTARLCLDVAARNEVFPNADFLATRGPRALLL